MKKQNSFSCVICLLLILLSCKKMEVDVTEGFNNGAIEKGIFSISPSEQIQFSQGNLQYQASSQTWRFASSQYIQFSVGNVDEVHNDWIDLFVFSTNKTNFGIRMANEIKSWNDYVTSSNDFVDWGTLKISNTSYTNWRTLSKDQWLYMLHKREYAEEKMYHATVNGIEGFVLLPDTWDLPEGIDIIFTYNKLDMDNYKHNIYNSKEWRKLQSAGAVFLPCKTKSNPRYYNSCYWTSSMVLSGRRPGFISFVPYQGCASNDAYFNTVEVCSVRLVRDVK